MAVVEGITGAQAIEKVPAAGSEVVGEADVEGLGDHEVARVCVGLGATLGMSCKQALEGNSVGRRRRHE